MNRKIAVIVTELLKDFTDSILKKFSDRFSYRIFTYHVFEDIPQIAQQITEEFDGILTSGSFPAHMLKLSCPTERRPVAFFNTDDAALFRLLLKLLEQNRQLDFHRVYADIVELFGVSLADFIEGKASLPDITVLSDEDFSLERMRQVEKEQYEKHLSLWMEGKRQRLFSLSQRKICSRHLSFPAAGDRAFEASGGHSRHRDLETGRTKGS